MAPLTARLVVNLAQQFDDARKMEAQRDVIAQQQLYERDLEAIRREMRAFRHDYKNLLAGLSEQADEGELDGRFIRVHRAYLAADKIEAVAFKNWHKENLDGTLKALAGLVERCA